jgi:hypothetical protein
MCELPVWICFNLLLLCGPSSLNLFFKGLGLSLGRSEIEGLFVEILVDLPVQ